MSPYRTALSQSGSVSNARHRFIASSASRSYVLPTTHQQHSILLVYSQVRQHSQAFFGLHLGLTLPNPSIFRQSATGGHPCRVGMHLLVCKQVQLYRSASAAGWLTPSHVQHAASHGRRQPYDLNSSMIISSVPIALSINPFHVNLSMSL